MAETTIYEPKYENSWALVIGINSYAKVSPLLFAKNDAAAIVESLKSNFAFPAANIITLLDQAATGSEIRRAFFKFSDDKAVGPNDRLVVFFAGHGHTIPGKRGEVGFLVPSDGDAFDKATLIRWDELTRNADLILAKHIFFIMDACYGGLALDRQPSFGSMRFIGDMLQRYARQVLTAGKPDEPVSDGNGVRPGHSLFTAHLLNALEGGASTQEGIITASGVMAYVFDKVGTDQYSKQTPHYGFIDGDGDFIFKLPASISSDSGSGGASSVGSGRGDNDILINTSPEINIGAAIDLTTSDTMKELLSEQSRRIKLDDFISQKIRAFLAASDLRNFPVQGGATPEEFVERVGTYEHVTKDLQQIVVLLAKWGEGAQLQILEKIFTRLAEADKGSSGVIWWLRLSWYPLLLLMYSAGISALAARKYDALKIVFSTTVQPDPDSEKPPQPLVVPVVSRIMEIHDQFKMLPGQERKYVPISEHIFKAVQPTLEDELLLGRGYEGYFDEFEILMALTFSDFTGRGWGPPGRFAWKYSRGYGINPFEQLMATEKVAGANWGPLVAGLFRGSPERFSEVAQDYQGQLSRLHW